MWVLVKSKFLILIEAVPVLKQIGFVLRNFCNVYRKEWFNFRFQTFGASDERKAQSVWAAPIRKVCSIVCSKIDRWTDFTLPKFRTSSGLNTKYPALVSSLNWFHFTVFCGFYPSFYFISHPTLSLVFGSSFFSFHNSFSVWKFLLLSNCSTPPSGKNLLEMSLFW